MYSQSHRQYKPCRYAYLAYAITLLNYRFPFKLHKSTVKGKSVHAIGVTPNPLKNRHNATESLKKKLGITGTSFMLAKSMAPLSTLSSPMISGRNGRVTKKAGTIAGSFIESAMTRVPNVVSNGSRRMEKKDGKAPQLEGKVPRKYTKRNENKKGPHMDVDLLQTPEDLWFEEKPCQVECTAPLHIRNWFVPEITSSSCLPAGPRNSLSLSVSREERLELKRCELRRKSIQLRGAQLHREILTARRRFLMVQSSLLQESDADGLKVGRNCWPKEFRICGVDACKNEALIFTAFCPQHITQSDEQQLFTPCTAKFADNKPCRVPVFDISHELPLCREHARKVENFGRAPPVQRSKKDMVAAIRTPRMTKISAKTATAPVYQQPSAIQKTTKRYANAASNMKLDYSPLLTVAADNAPKFHQRSNQTPAMFSRFGTPNRTAAVTASVNEPDDFVDELVDEEDEDSIGGGEEDSLLNNSSKQTYVVKRKNFKELKTVGVSGAAARLNQSDVLVVVSENSSAYESSEDTGVGGLSESEMIGTFNCN